MPPFLKTPNKPSQHPHHPPRNKFLQRINALGSFGHRRRLHKSRCRREDERTLFAHVIQCGERQAERRKAGEEENQLQIGSEEKLYCCVDFCIIVGYVLLKSPLIRLVGLYH